MSKPQIEDLCESIKFDSQESKLLLSWYDGDTVVKICMDNFMSNHKYNSYFKTICSKIYNYLNYQNITFN